MSRRLQCVSINGKKSNLQGSILGLLLFLIFINDLPDCASSSAMLLYADDAKCYRPIANPSDCQLLQDDLCRLFHWSLEWKLKLNIPKCVVLSFTSGNTPALSSGSPYHIDDQDICKTVCHRDLSILISGDLSWSPNLFSCLSDARSSAKFLTMLSAYWLRKISSLFSIELLLYYLATTVRKCTAMHH